MNYYDNKAFMDYSVHRVHYMKDYKPIDVEAELSKMLLQYKSNQIYKITYRKLKIKRIYGLC